MYAVYMRRIIFIKIADYGKRQMWIKPIHSGAHKMRTFRLILYWKCVCSPTLACVGDKMLFFRSKYLLLWLCKCSLVTIREEFSLHRMIHTLIYTPKRSKRTGRKRAKEYLSVVENIYHSKMFFRSIWNTKRVPETWWGFGIAAELSRERKRGKNKRNIIFFFEGRVEKEKKWNKIKLMVWQAAAKQARWVYLTTTISKTRRGSYNFISIAQRRMNNVFLPNLLVECFRWLERRWERKKK